MVEASATRVPSLAETSGELRGELRMNESMNRHVSWRAGGPVARAYFPADVEDLSVFMKTLATDEPVLFVGLGSNLLVRDGGFAGTVIFTHKALKTLRIEEGGEIYAEAGVAAPKLARFAGRHEREGAEFLAGIPGTVGGALAMNAGCYGSQTWRVSCMCAHSTEVGRSRYASRTILK